MDTSIEQKAEGISKDNATFAIYAHRCCVKLPVHGFGCIIKTGSGTS